MLFCIVTHIANIVTMIILKLYSFYLCNLFMRDCKEIQVAITRIGVRFEYEFWVVEASFGVYVHQREREEENKKEPAPRGTGS